MTIPSTIPFCLVEISWARMRGTQALRDTQAKRKDRFDGLIPVIEDWHARMTLMKVPPRLSVHDIILKKF